MSSIPAIAILDRTVTFTVVVHDPDTKIETDPDSAPTYRIYRDAEDIPVLTGTMDKLDDANTMGTYKKEVSTVGWAEFSTYTVKVRAVVNGNPGGITLSTVCMAAPWETAIRTLTSSSTAPGVGLQNRVWTVYRGDTLVRTFTTIAADASITKVQFSVKRNLNDTDLEAAFAVDSKTGVVRILENAPTLTEQIASFVLPAGILTVPATLMSKLSALKYKYDVQVWRGTAVQTIEIGVLWVQGDVTLLTAASPSSSGSASLSPSASWSPSPSASLSPSSSGSASQSPSSSTSVSGSVSQSPSGSQSPSASESASASPSTAP